MSEASTESTDRRAGLERRAMAETQAWIERARELLEASPRQLPMPTLCFDLRGRSAGQTVFSRRSRDCRIRLNADLLVSHPQAMLAETVPHEVAHVAIFRLYGRRVRPHGREWRALMQAFGVDDSPCHDLPTEPVRRLRRHRYRCGCEEPAWLTSIRHKRVLQGTEYRCRRCGQALSPDGDDDTDAEATGPGASAAERRA